MQFYRGLAIACRRGLGRTVHGLGFAVRADVRHLQSQLDGLKSSVDILKSDVEGSLAELTRGVDTLLARMSNSENLAAVETFSRFVRHAELRTAPLVSVVLPTYDRPRYLRRAIDSVLAQRYQRWELLVVDDGGRLDSRAVVEETEDPRVHWTRIEHQGACAARNAALSSAAGEIVAYLDDDNIMDVDWLYSVVWGFENHPGTSALYGGIVVDDVLRVKGSSSGELPRKFLYPWSRAGLRAGNLADMGAIAHRAGLAEAHFDETLKTAGDWDLLVRLTAGRDPLVLPAIACYYMTDAPLRLTGTPSSARDEAKVRARATTVET